MDELTRIEDISKYNEMLGVETFHPLVAVIDFFESEADMSTPSLHGFIYHVSERRKMRGYQIWDEIITTIRKVHWCLSRLGR